MTVPLFSDKKAIITWQTCLFISFQNKWWYHNFLPLTFNSDLKMWSYFLSVWKKKEIKPFKRTARTSDSKKKQFDSIPEMRICNSRKEMRTKILYNENKPIFLYIPYPWNLSLTDINPSTDTFFRCWRWVLTVAYIYTLRILQ